MTQDERDLLLALADILVCPRDLRRVAALDLVKTLRDRVSNEIRPGDEIAVKVVVTRIGDGLVHFRSDDGTEAYRRVGDIVR